MSPRSPLYAIGLRLSRSALRILKERGILARASVSLEHQHVAKRYLVRGVESGGAAGDVGHYVTFAQENGEPLQCFCPVETIGVNGPHAVVLAPALIRIEMLRKASTYELLITQHRPDSASNGARPQLESKLLFRGIHGRLELDLSGQHKPELGTVLPSFCSRSGEEIGIPRRFRSAVRAATAAVNCLGCSHSHHTVNLTKQKPTEISTGEPMNPAG